MPIPSSVRERDIGMRGRWIIIFLPERLNNAGWGPGAGAPARQLGAHAHEGLLLDERL
jgi:hypothetical protein